MKKILVIGGACQGKTEWVQENFPDYKSVSPEMLLKENREGKLKSGVYINRLHMILKQWLQNGRNCKEEMDLLRQNPSWLIVSDEIGNGIVPVEKDIREWRECTGRILCDLAKDADEVYRIHCGIPVKIKGGDKAC